MPAAALDADKGLWRTLRKSAKGEGYLFNHKALAKVFRAKLLAALAEEGLPLPADCPEKWVVDCKWRHHWLPERPGHLSLARQQDPKDSAAHRQWGRLSLADVAACPAQGFQAHAQLWLFAPQQQTLDRALEVAGVQTTRRPSIAATDPGHHAHAPPPAAVHLLRRAHGDRAPKNIAIHCRATDPQAWSQSGHIGRLRHQRASACGCCGCVRATRCEMRSA